MEKNESIHLEPYTLDLRAAMGHRATAKFRSRVIWSLLADAVIIGIAWCFDGSGLTVLVFSIASVWGLIRLLTRGSALPLVRMFFTVDRDGLGIRTEYGDQKDLKRIGWAEVTEVTENEHGVMLSLKSGRARHIPNVCFGNDSQRRTLLSLARSSGNLPKSLEP